jgi:putative transcriptional regulator
MNQKFITVVELPEFERFAKRCLSESDRTNITVYLATHPTAGVILKGSGGLRKIRFANENNKGKSGGVRVIYFYHNDNIPLF